MAHRRYPPGLAVALLALAAPALAQPVVVDGDSIKLDGQPWRLHGMDAPESAQTCRDGWPAGQHATAFLRALVAGKWVACELVTRDRYGRLVGLCRANSEDLGGAMVRAGMAHAFVRYSQQYVGLEQLARQDGLGVHAQGCIPAWEWRAMRR